MTESVSFLVSRLQTLLREISRLQICIETPELPPDEKETCLQTIHNLESEYSLLQKGLSAISAAEREKETAAKQLADWKEIVPKCRVARDEAERLALRLVESRKTFWQLQAEADIAAANFSQHQRSLLKPSDYPTEQELESERVTGLELVDKLETARSALRTANQAQHAAQLEALRSARTFSDLASQEIRLRPKTANRPEYGDILSIG